MCDVGYYCPDGEGRVACPSNTTSPVGADSGDYCFMLGKYLNCTFEEDFCGFTTYYDYYGYLKRGSGNGMNAPSVDHTTGTKDGFYAFYNAENNNLQHHAELKTPWVVVSQNDHATLQFYVQLKMYGDSSYNNIRVSLEGSVNSGWSTKTLLTMYKNTTDWTKQSLSITKFGELRIVFKFNNYYYNTISKSYKAAIDDVVISSTNGCNLLGQAFKSFEHPKVLPDIKSYHDCLERCLEQIDCAAFTFSSTQVKSCKLKAVGTSTELVASTSSNSALMSCIQGNNYCKGGEYKKVNDSSCYQCLPGTFRVAGSNVSICDKCPLGTFSDEAGLSECKNCSEGFYTAAEGSSNCTQSWSLILYIVIPLLAVLLVAAVVIWREQVKKILICQRIERPRSENITRSVLRK